MTDDQRSREALRQIAQDPIALSDPRRVEGLLRDLAPGARRETFLLVQAQRLGLVEALRSRLLPPRMLAAQWIHVLQEDLALTSEAATWTVTRWAEALAAAGLADAPIEAEPVAPPPLEMPAPPRPRTAPAADPPAPARAQAAVPAGSRAFPAPPQPRESAGHGVADQGVQLAAESWALRHRGESHRRRGDFGAAMRDLNASLALTPNDAEALLSRGDTFRELGQTQRARADLDRSIGISPTARAFAARAVLHAQTGSTESARLDMAMACALDPERKSFEEWWRHF
ncbi:hypothetical protein Aab01nite_31830 [Paractinoplanes abujensis]|uniref:Tetratricopeptide (TPR) repeat protein n=1 Tax=Paractinoplanes abujensis TaxID=882441 RepID=A0A7W7D258_9ACTN|nr:tetratricopeptide repeat protein [Actinoplanes abujensis]MBB4697925.1 tetratricopeptide (TPR) repeat protein [Actinoplanes abujensis]GID19593.1 hypothetical protein Aab01nite_31830 [Actinoplanes abujensis]